MRICRICQNPTHVFLWPKSCPPFLEATGSVEAAKVDGTSVVSRLMELRMVGGSGTCELPAIWGGKSKLKFKCMLGCPRKLVNG